MNSSSSQNAGASPMIGTGAEPLRFPLPDSGDRSLSLACAVATIARHAGGAADLDDVVAALGLGLATVAVPDEPDLSDWALHGRDAFLVGGGRLFGLQLRAMHPPPAARGLDRASEFRQHFDASYKPLVLRALEHGQPVLAWRGWPDDRAGLWGIITEASAGGIGLCGVAVPPVGCEAALEALPLLSPPIQLYVVEAVEAVRLDADELLAVALDHARRFCDNALMETFGIVSGPAAFDAWLTRIRAAREELALRDSLAEGHSRLAATVVAGRQSTLRFLSRHIGRVETRQRYVLEALAESCRTAVTSLSESTDPAVVATLMGTSSGRAGLADRITSARAAATKALTALQSWAKATGGR